MNTDQLTKEQFLELLNDQVEHLFEIRTAWGYVEGCRTLANVMEDTISGNPEVDDFFGRRTEPSNA